MCEGGDCPLKENCYRYLAKPSQMLQSYFIEPPYKDGQCEYFWDNNERVKFDRVKRQPIFNLEVKDE